MMVNSHIIRTVLLALALLLSVKVRTVSSESGDGYDQRQVSLAAMERLTPSAAEPPVMFTLRSAGQGPDLLAAVSAWQIQIFDTGGRKVSYLQGRNNPPAAVPWAGVSAGGEPLPDGFYDARFVWLDSDKRSHATPKTAVTLFTPLELRSLSGKKFKFLYTAEGLVLTIAESMLFKSGEARVQEQALPALREIAMFLKSHPESNAVIRGHTDSSGSLGWNLSLSRQRAGYVRQYFIDAGIDPDRLAYEGYGASRPVATNATEAGRAENRRLEIVVLKTPA